MTEGKTGLAIALLTRQEVRDPQFVLRAARELRVPVKPAVQYVYRGGRRRSPACRRRIFCFLFL